jgi:hypothetical protein
VLLCELRFLLSCQPGVTSTDPGKRRNPSAPRRFEDDITSTRPSKSVIPGSLSPWPSKTLAVIASKLSAGVKLPTLMAIEV